MFEIGSRWSRRPSDRVGFGRPRRGGLRQGGVRRTATAFVLVAVFAVGVGTDRILWDGGDDAGAASSLTTVKEFQVLQDAWNVLHDNYVEVNAVSDKELLYGASRGMLEAVGDTGHTRFLDPEEAEAFEEATRGEFVGIGVELDIKDDFPIVIAPIDGSPADEAGVRPGDVILDVDGMATEGLSLEDISKLLRGDENTEVAMTLRHNGEDETFPVKLVRRKITLRPVSWSMLPGSIAHVRLSEFSTGAADGLKEALATIQSNGAKGLVLDLRNNPGGLVTEAIGVANLFLPEGATVFQEKGRDGQAKPVTAFGQGARPTLPIVVLINRGSASAAEIIASTLRDNERATLIGEKTYGTGTVLLPYELNDGSVALIGTALWLTADGEQIWKKGVLPSVEVKLPADVFPVRPVEDPDVTETEFAALKDEQLRVAHARVSEAAPVGNAVEQ